MGPMYRHLSRLAYLVLAVVTLGLVVGAPPAAAGGPTSVLIVEPGTGRTAAAYYDDPAYAALDAMLGSGPAGPRQAADGSFGDRGSGRSITVTWLIHDMAVWRVNRVFPDAPGGPWVLTSAWDENGTLPQLGTWSRPDSPKKLVAALDGALEAVADSAGSAHATVTVVETVPAAEPAAAGVAASSASATAVLVAESTQVTAPPSRPAILVTGAAVGAALVLLAWTCVGLVGRRRSPS